MEDRREKTHTYYQLQTKLYHVEDKLVSFSSLSLTLRQCFVLILGGCASIQVWHMLEESLFLLHIPVLVLLITAGVPSILALLLAMVRIADRYGEDWALVLLQYVLCCRISLWQPYAPHALNSLHSSTRKHGKRSRQAHLYDQDEEQLHDHQERKDHEDNE
jgi:hypothetical protein